MLRQALRKLPLPIKHVLRRSWASVRLGILRIFSSNSLFAGIYYTFFSARFRREHLAVLAGRKRYFEELAGGSTSSPLLRRNIHRLEKGLIMRPRRAVFAEGFVEETVTAYRHACLTTGYSAAELKWARDVLEEYFSAVSDTPATLRAHAAFECPPGGQAARADSDTEKYKPYSRSESPTTKIVYDDLFQLFVRRRSVRFFLDTPVPVGLLRKAIDAAAQAPSACNRQPFRFIVSTEPEWAARIAGCAGGTIGFSQQLPAIIVVVGNLAAYPEERDRHLIYIDSALAAMQLMLAAETLGLATCPINWPDIEAAERRIQRILRLPVHERVVMLMGIGYGDPDSGIAYSQKKQSDLLVQEFRAE